MILQAHKKAPQKNYGAESQKSQKIFLLFEM